MLFIQANESFLTCTHAIGAFINKPVERRFNSYSIKIGMFVE